MPLSFNFWMHPCSNTFEGLIITTNLIQTHVYILFSLLSVGAQTEMKKVVGDNATLPCHHQFPPSSSLDIEWLLQKPNSKQKV
ncbi:hypothetical protein ATANTOWER_009931, partial [Ataeniobius toweri]|nr:hypothetical protein [Ataeniobius toweri]